jgi:hypothetical protein
VNTETEASSVDQEQAVFTPTKSELALSEGSEKIVLAETENIRIQTNSTSTDAEKDQTEPKVNVASHGQTESIQPNREHRDELQVRLDEDKRKIHPYIFVSLGFLLGSLLLLILLFSSIFAGMAGMLVLMLFLSALFGVLSFIFASIANRAIKKSPEEWKGKVGGIVLFILGIIFFSVAAVLWLFVLLILAIFQNINFVGFM